MDAVAAYKKLIDAIVLWSGSAPLMHVHVGLAIYLGTQMMVRHRRSWLIGLNLVFIAEMTNEVLDWLAHNPRWTLHDTLLDVLGTMMWPVAIALVTQYRRRRWVKTQPAPMRQHVPIAPPAIG